MPYLRAASAAPQRRAWASRLEVLGGGEIAKQETRGKGITSAKPFDFLSRKGGLIQALPRNEYMEDQRLKRQLIELGHLKNWSRRGRGPEAENFRFIRGLLNLGLWLTGLGCRGRRNATNPVFKHLRLAFDSLPEAFDGYRILHLSDLHIDGVPDLVVNTTDQLRDLEIDLCVLTGDYRFAFKGPCHNVYPQMQRLLSGVNARQGIVGILGNHDASEMIPEFERLGVRMLVNQSLELRQGLHSIWLVGLDDPHYFGCENLPAALIEVPEDAFKILLVHSPEMLEDAAQSGIHLYLCGHTHGGQICLPFLGPVITHANCPRNYVRGAWQYRNVTGYTSPGVGTSGVSARFLCPPELVVIELCRTSSQGSSQETEQHITVRSAPVSSQARAL
jgi:predicted MPP superfamily phosphohydrolase